MRLLDACAGLGIDAMQAATAGAQVTAIEADPVRAALLQRNVQHNNLNIAVIAGTSPTDWPDQLDIDIVYADFDRRRSPSTSSPSVPASTSTKNYHAIP